jgi:poly-gamma-glutamate synthesis protein (capsule biosynthesis protein)
MTQIRLFLCGDVMTGRGVDQVLPSPCPPNLYEGPGISALHYVALAERAHGRVPRPVSFPYIWGDALDVFEQLRPDARIINLETSITTSETPFPKPINYRMHPDNVDVLTAAGIGCCTLANNHVLDWGEQGLLESLQTLARASIHTAGGGPDLGSAQAPAVLETPGPSRLLIFGFGALDSGIPPSWAATASRPGVSLLPDFSEATALSVARIVAAAKRPGDIAIASIHWGGNWGYQVSASHRRFARALIDLAAIDIVHGHSSHHPKAIEVYRDRLILYGCGDFVDDYEGIRGLERYRSDLVLMYFVDFNIKPAGLAQLRMVPLQIRNFRLNRSSSADRRWLRQALDRECRAFTHHVVAREDSFWLEWS